jgi:hypothetical protein
MGACSIFERVFIAETGGNPGFIKFSLDCAACARNRTRNTRIRGIYRVFGLEKIIFDGIALVSRVAAKEKCTLIVHCGARD